MGFPLVRADKSSNMALQVKSIKLPGCNLGVLILPVLCNRGVLQYVMDFHGCNG